MNEIDPASTAILLIGYQRDYFDEKGALHEVIEESSRVSGTLGNTKAMLDGLADSSVTMISTPIVFSETYNELENPIGILKVIKDVEAFKIGTPGAETIDLIEQFGDRILEISGKKGFDAFSNTELLETLVAKGITCVVIAGAVTSICVNATALRAFDEGFDVMVLEDCTSGRTTLEQDMFCTEIFPLFTEVLSHSRLLERIGVVV